MHQFGGGGGLLFGNAGEEKVIALYFMCVIFLANKKKYLYSSISLVKMRSSNYNLLCFFLCQEFAGENT